MIFFDIRFYSEHSSGNDISETDRAHFRLKAVCILLRLIRVKSYEEQLGPEQFQLLSSVIQDPIPAVRTTFLKKLHKGLKTLRLPVGYLSIVSLCATDPEKEILAEARQCIIANVKIRRDFVKSTDHITSALQFNLPENALSYLIHLLAHHKEFHASQESLLKQSARYLDFFLEHIFQSDNFSFLVNILDGIKHTKDAQDPNSKNIYILAELALKLVKNKSESKSWNQTGVQTNADYYLPQRLYQLPTKSEMAMMHQTFLSNTFQLSKSFPNPQDKITPTTLKDEKEENMVAIKEKLGTSLKEEQATERTSKNLEKRKKISRIPQKITAGKRRKEKPLENKKEKEEEEEDEEEPLMLTRRSEKRKKTDASRETMKEASTLVKNVKKQREDPIEDEDSEPQEPAHFRGKKKRN